MPQLEKPLFNDLLDSVHHVMKRYDLDEDHPQIAIDLCSDFVGELIHKAADEYYAPLLILQSQDRIRDVVSARCVDKWC